MYRAPVSEIAFTLRHVAGLGDAIAAGAFPDLSDDLVDAVLAEAGRFATEELAPLNRVGDLEGARLEDGVVTTPPGWARCLSRLVRRRLERHRRAGARRRAGAPDPALRRHAGDVERRLHGFHALPDADHGRGRRAGEARQRGAEGDLSAGASSPANGPRR